MRYYILFCQHYYYLEWLRQLVEFCVRGTVQILNGTNVNTRLDTLIGTVARKRAERPVNHGSVPSNSNKFCSSAKVKTGSGGHPSSQGSPFAPTVRPAGCEVHHSCPSAEVRNDCSCISAYSTRLYGLQRNKCKFYLYSIYQFLPILQGQLFYSAGLLVRLHVSLGSYQQLNGTFEYGIAKFIRYKLIKNFKSYLHDYCTNMQSIRSSYVKSQTTWNLFLFALVCNRQF